MRAFIAFGNFVCIICSAICSVTRLLTKIAEIKKNGRLVPA